MFRLAFCLCALAASPAAAERWSLPRLLAHVTREHPQVVAQRAVVAVRRSQLLEQQLRWLPFGELRFAAAGAPLVSCIQIGNVCARTTVVDLERAASGRAVSERAPVNGPLLVFGAGLTQPIYTAGKIETAIGAAKGGIAYEEANLLQTEADIALAAVRTFVTIKTARAAMSALETGVGKMRDWLSRINAELDGSNPSLYVEADVSRLKINIGNVDAWILAEQRNVRAGEEALKALTGDPEADVSEEDLDWQDVPVADAALWQERMLRDRAEMQSARGGLAYYRQYRLLQLTLALPDVALVSGVWWGYSPTIEKPALAYANLPPSSLGGAFGFAVRESLDVGPKLARWDALRHEERMQHARFALGRAYWTFEVGKAYADFLEARRRLDETTRGERVTRGWYASVDSNLALGLYTDGREVVEVLNNWMAFRTRHLQAIADTHIALATLNRLSGQPTTPGITLGTASGEAPRLAPLGSPIGGAR